MSDLISAVVAHSAALNTLADARSTLADAREGAEAAMDLLVGTATENSDREIREAAERVVYCRTEIEKVKAALSEARSVLRTAQSDLRQAARAGDAKAAEATLADAEETFGDKRAEMKDLRRAKKEAEAKLVELAGAVA